MTAVRADVAALLRAGVPYRQIRAQLRVGNPTIIATRKAIGMPPGRPGGHPMTDEERRTATLQRHPEAAAMLRAGATYRQIRAALGISPPTISKIRRDLDIPVREPHRPARTTAQALAIHAQPHTDGHTHWTGPHTSRMPQLWAEGRCHSVLRVAFQLHHNRQPVGPVRRDCNDPDCITGAHLTDHTIRQANHRADAAYDAIFGGAS